MPSCSSAAGASPPPARPGPPCNDCGITLPWPVCRALGRELLVTRERQPRLQKKERARRHAETSKDLSRAGEGSRERPSRGGEHAELAALELLSLDGMPDQLNKQKEFIQGLMELLKESLDDMPAELNEQGS